MLLKGAEIARYLARPDPTRPALLIYGQDAMRVALKRAEAVAALTGPDAEAEMRLTRLAGGDLRRDAAALMDEIKAVGFFPGPRVVLFPKAKVVRSNRIGGAILSHSLSHARGITAAPTCGRRPLRSSGSDQRGRLGDPERDVEGRPVAEVKLCRGPSLALVAGEHLRGAVPGAIGDPGFRAETP